MKRALLDTMLSSKAHTFSYLLLFLCVGRVLSAPTPPVDSVTTTSTVALTTTQKINNNVSTTKAADSTEVTPAPAIPAKSVTELPPAGKNEPNDNTTTETVTTAPNDTETTSSSTATSSTEATTVSTSTSSVAPTTNTTNTTTTTTPTPSTTTTSVTPSTTVTSSTVVSTTVLSTSAEPSEPSVTTASVATKSPSTSDHGRRFDAPSFIGGIVLAVGLLAILCVGYKFYRARTEHNYHTL